MKIQSSLSGKDRYIASVDLGSHTARFLLCRITDAPNILQPVVRKRFYTNMAEGFNEQGAGIISRESKKRALDALYDFSTYSEKYSPEIITGAATGVFRRAENSEELLNEIQKKTGINIKVVSGEEEAEITLKGIIHALGLPGCPDVFFDLGGSTTEIIYREHDNRKIVSLPIGAFVLNGRYLKHDPPLKTELEGLGDYVHKLLAEAVGQKKGGGNIMMTGSGGTVTSLAAMAKGLDRDKISPEVINGILLGYDEIKSIHKTIVPLSLKHRTALKSIDRGRAEVILAGTSAVLAILEYFNAGSLTVSYSDILEGLILSYLDGEKND